jgi:hypothetical protein
MSILKSPRQVLEHWTSLFIYVIFKDNVFFAVFTSNIAKQVSMKDGNGCIDHNFSGYMNPCSFSWTRIHINLLQPRDYFMYHHCYSKILHGAHIAFRCFVRSQNKQWLLPYPNLADWFCITEVETVYARSGLSPYIKEIRLVFKGLSSQYYFISCLRYCTSYTN